GVQNGGGGVTVLDKGNFFIRENALIDSTVKLAKGRCIVVTGQLSRPYPVATITPQVYTGAPRLVELNGTTDSSLFSRFAVTPNGRDYHVDKNGKLSSS
ncbi:MAG: hypothetical protein LBH73_02085, partial [Spirochaetaceae bacterium]|nr:hypothetical protein [Spirochaetaceae bacterium]